jgi:predicted kinase
MSKLILICGIPFAGKSTLASVIRNHVPCIEIDVDDTKTQLYGSEIADEQLSDSDWVRIYDETDRLTAAHLSAGKLVIDASRSFGRDERERAKRVAESAGAQLATIFVDTPADVARQRLLANRQVMTRHDVPDSEFEHILQAWEPPAPEEAPLVVHHGADIRRWVSEHLDALR